MLNEVCLLGILHKKGVCNKTKKGSQAMSFVVKLPNRYVVGSHKMTFVHVTTYGAVAHSVDQYGEIGCFIQVVGCLQEMVDTRTNAKALGVVARNVCLYKELGASSDIDDLRDFEKKVFEEEEFIDFGQ